MKESTEKMSTIKPFFMFGFERSGTWKEVRPGMIRISLEEPDDKGRTRLYLFPASTEHGYCLMLTTRDRFPRGDIDKEKGHAEAFWPSREAKQPR